MTDKFAAELIERAKTYVKSFGDKTFYPSDLVEGLGVDYETAQKLKFGFMTNTSSNSPTDKLTPLATLVKQLDGAGENSAANLRWIWGSVSDLAQATLAEVERIDRSAGASWRAHKILEERFIQFFDRLDAEVERIDAEIAEIDDLLHGEGDGDG